MVSLIGRIASLAGAIIWVYGYYSTGHPALFDWAAYTPWWIAEFLPNLESEIGLALCCVATVLVYWPARTSAANSTVGAEDRE